MSRRQFAIQKRLGETRGGGLLDIPHTAVLRHVSPSDLIQQFTNQWGAAPDGVILPVTNPDGLLFDVEGLSEARSQYSSGFADSLSDFPDVVHEFARHDTDIYLMLDPTLPFVESDPLHIVDIVGGSSGSVCFGNPRSQDVIAAILGTAVDIVIETTPETGGRLKGVALDLVDILPMGGDDGQLKLNCFCPSCQRFFDQSSPGLIKRFKTSPNPWNLLLQEHGDGIAHVNEIRTQYGADDLVGLGRQQGFNRAFADESTPFLIDQAQAALEYIESRHHQVVFSADAVFNQALDGLDQKPRRILLTEGMYYSWTAGLQLERLDVTRNDDTVTPYDEIWFDAQSTDLVLMNTDFRSYMARRSHYYIDHFFQLTATASNSNKRAMTGIGRIPIARLKDLLRTRAAQAVGSLMTGQTSLTALPDVKGANTQSRRVGFVGVGLTTDIADRIIEGLRIAPGLADQLPDNMSFDLDGLREMLERQQPDG